MYCPTLSLIRYQEVAEKAFEMCLASACRKWQLSFDRCRILQKLNPRVPTQTGKPGKMEKLFPVREKSGNFVQTGKVREIWTKYWKSQGNLENFYFLCFFNWTVFVKMDQVFSFQAHLVGVLSGYPIWGKLVSHSLYL